MKINLLTNTEKKLDIIGGIIFAGLILLFMILFFNNDSFFNWAFQRHHNLLSWYLRPIFILPIVYFAYKRSWTWVMASIFCLFTSMFWFPAPIENSNDVNKFLEFEMSYLKGNWDTQKIFLSLTVPAFFITLITATWKRSWKVMVISIVAAAVLKVIWSALFAGFYGLSILKPAVLGLVICLVAIYLYRYGKNKKSA